MSRRRKVGALLSVSMAATILWYFERILYCIRSGLEIIGWMGTPEDAPRLGNLLFYYGPALMLSVLAIACTLFAVYLAFSILPDPLQTWISDVVNRLRSVLQRHPVWVQTGLILSIVFVSFLAFVFIVDASFHRSIAQINNRLASVEKQLQPDVKRARECVSAKEHFNMFVRECYTRLNEMDATKRNIDRAASDPAKAKLLDRYTRSELNKCQERLMQHGLIEPN